VAAAPQSLSILRMPLNGAGGLVIRSDSGGAGLINAPGKDPETIRFCARGSSAGNRGRRRFFVACCANAEFGDDD